jgi:hypothetical protein
MITVQTRPAHDRSEAITAPVPVVGPEQRTPRRRRTLVPLTRVPNTAHQHTDPEPEVALKSPGRAMLDQMGGLWGVVYTNVPAIVFSFANSYFPLVTTTAIALASAVVLAVFRVAVRKEKVVAASGGIIGVAFAGAITVWTGSPRDFFLVGIWAAALATVALVVSLVARRPLTGLAWSWFHGKQFAWRDHRKVLRAHDVATLFAAVVFAARFAVNQTLYLADATGLLAVAKLVTGMPLTALMALVAIWAFRRSTKLLIKKAPAATPGR